jgi:hypothetical protein
MVKRGGVRQRFGGGDGGGWFPGGAGDQKEENGEPKKKRQPPPETKSVRKALTETSSALNRSYVSMSLNIVSIIDMS